MNCLWRARGNPRSSSAGWGAIRTSGRGWRRAKQGGSTGLGRSGRPMLRPPSDRLGSWRTRG
eukprot:429717-Alexandrium_andersonii.AAC.1